MKTKKRIQQLTAAQFDALFPDEDACKGYLVNHRWPHGVVCPRCSNDEVSAHGTLPFHWQCSVCSPTETSYRFSVLVGTIFENTNKPLKDWFRVIHLMLTSKKGMSALQIYRYMGFGSYKTAWHMCHRVRAGLANEDFRQLMGIVEVDETFVGGKVANRHKSRRDDDDMPPKVPVVGAIHTNTIEGFWSILKRGVIGTYHKVSAKYLPLYVAEFQFRYNNRGNEDIFGTAIAGC